MECFLNDLAGASLSDEHEKKRVTLERKIISMRKITPPPCLSPLEEKQESDQKEEDNIISHYRARSFSYPSISNYTFTSLKEMEEDNEMDAREVGIEKNEISCVENEEAVCEPQDEQLDKGLCSKKKFERLREAYLDSMKVPRRRSASESQVTTSRHRQPNHEYIKSICNAFVFDVENDSRLRKPNKKGFNVAWGLSADVCG